jgi:fibronectin-binding autotransporter adhesin
LRAAAQVSCSGSVSVGASGGTLDTNGFSITVSGSAGGAGTFEKDGAGLLTVSAGLSGIAGSILVNGGTLRSSVGNIDAFSDSVTVTIAAGAAVDETFGNGEILGNVAGGGTFIGLAGHNIEIGLNNANTTFSGAIRAGAADSGQATPGTALSNFTKSGTGTTTLTSSASDFKGTVQINQGVLEVACLADRDESSSIGQGVDSGNDITLGTSTTTGTLRYLGPSASSNRAIALNASSTLDIADPGAVLSLAGSLTGSGSLVKQGAGTLLLSGDDSFTGGTFVDMGTLVVAGPEALPNDSNLDVAAGALLLFSPAASGGPAVINASPAASIAAVPEPATGWLFLTGLSLWMLPRRSTRCR